jgi:S-adenosyl methyltransferase
MTSDDAAAPGGRTATGKAGPLPFDITVAHQARMYDYVLGGKDNYAADRAAMDAALEVWPDMAFGARANRAFLGRAVRYLAADAGIRQFLDIGTGIPTAGNTHEVAQAIASAATAAGHLERLGPAAAHLPRPRAGSAVLHRHGPSGTRPGASRRMARPARHDRQGQLPHVGRRRPQALRTRR